MATLVSLILVIGLVGVFQAFALANTKTLKRLAQAERLQLERDAVRELSRPFVAEAMLQFDKRPRLSSGGAPYEVRFEGRLYTILAHPVREWISSSTTQPKTLGIVIQTPAEPR